MLGVFTNPIHPSNLLPNANGEHLDGGGGVVVAGRHFRDCLYQIHALNNLSKHWVGTFSGPVKPIQEGIVGHVDKELRTSRFGLACGMNSKT